MKLSDEALDRLWSVSVDALLGNKHEWWYHFYKPKAPEEFPMLHIGAAQVLLPRCPDESDRFEPREAALAEDRGRLFFQLRIWDGLKGSFDDEYVGAAVKLDETVYAVDIWHDLYGAAHAAHYDRLIRARALAQENPQAPPSDASQ